MKLSDQVVQVSVLVPCLNEEANLDELVARCLNVFDSGKLRGEVVLVDDGSTDSTKDVIERLVDSSEGRVFGVYHQQNQGITAGWRSALEHSRGRTVVTIDADLQYQPEDVLRLYRNLMDHSVDIVQGWRSAVGREKGSRYWVSRAFNVALNASFGMNLQDNKSGFVCCAREVFADILSYRGNYHYFQSFIMVAAHAKGYSYREVETLFEPRKQGTSFLDGSTTKASLRSFTDLAQAKMEYGSGRLKPSSAKQPGPGAHSLPPVQSFPSKEAHPARWRAYMATFRSSHWMITNAVEKHYEELLRTQWLSARRMKDLQDAKLRRLIRHAYRNVPYYRHMMQDGGLRPEDIRGQDDLGKLPLLSKEDVRRNLYFDITAENMSKADMLKIATSGSTGEPFVCYADREQLEFRWAATLRAQEWTGYRFGDPTVRLWHQTLGLNRSRATKEHIDAKLSNRLHIPVFEMSDDSLRRMVSSIQSHHPVLIDGYAEALDFLAHYIKSSSSELQLSPSGVMSSAQTLPESSRRLIESAFGCRVFDKYGSREFSGIAYECDAHDGLHVVAEGYIVEVLKDGRAARPGETGEVVVTDLNNYAMPFLRYRIGDLAVPMDSFPCVCGRDGPKLRSIQGRVQSIIVGENGRYVPGTFFAHALKEYDHILRRYQVVQESPGAIVLKVVKAGRYSASGIAEVCEVIRDHLGKGLRIDVQEVDAIALGRTGKHLAAVSKVPFEFQTIKERVS